MQEKHTEKNVSNIKTALPVMLILFVIGSIFGWVLELFLRRLFGARIWENPGFLLGPYLPIYGFGLLLMYTLNSVLLSVQSVRISWLFRAIILGLALTVLEYIGGLIFLRGFSLPLWDYSHAFGNVQGIICPLCSAMWLVFSGIYVLCVHKWMAVLSKKISVKPAFFAVMLLFVVITIDFALAMRRVLVW